ncbi:uncharacterized protein LOC132718223 [Ruditapes philippinarum]|uniref:uncharacterized protein LOC132718223 n=1 Tax=Ruditapes philippinarum TaxID=129788 RepID=UPI00295A66DD|nr:uncharacterized protein LOC132718223 [Ruditapes philippinarum]XP_060557851.1 uncharacterized protein LOC132718223 [Ruditapes philippinarum]
MKMKSRCFWKTEKPTKNECHTAVLDDNVQIPQPSETLIVQVDDGKGPVNQSDALIFKKYQSLLSQVKGLKTWTKFLSCVNILFMCTLVFTIVREHLAHDKRKADNDLSLNMQSISQDDKYFLQNLLSKDSGKIVKEHVFCTTCESFRGMEQLFFETIETNKCCLKDISNLIQLMSLTNMKTLNEFSSDIKGLASSIADVREDTDALTKEIFNSNETDDAVATTNGSTPKENIMWAMIMKNNKILNLILNRRRSVIYLVGTALGDGIYWSVETETGDLSYEGNSIHVKSGGQYMINCNIHFSKNVCDGTENIGYTMNQQYRPDEVLPLARTRTVCPTGRSIDEDLHLQTILQVGLGQRLTLKLEYDKSLQSMISKSNRNHYIIMYEL